MIDHLFDGAACAHDRKLEGQVVRDGVVVLGWRAGPDTDVRHLLHEMAHLVEIDDARAGEPGWGLRLGRWRSLMGHHWREFRTSAPIRRELRVGAYQFHMGASLGLYESRERFVAGYVRTTEFMPFDALCALAADLGVDSVPEAARRTLEAHLDDPAYQAWEPEWWRKQRILKGFRESQKIGQIRVAGLLSG